MEQRSAKGKRLWLLLLALVLLLSLFASGAGGQELEEASVSSSDRANQASQDNAQQENPRAAIARLKRAGTEVSVNSATDVAGFVQVPPGRALGLDRRESAAAQSAAFFREYGRAFGIRDAGSELVLLSSETDRIGMTHLTYRQLYQDVEVFAGLLRVHLDEANAVSAVNGLFVPEIAVDASPRLTAETAAAIAIAEVVANPLENETTGAVPELSAADLTVAANRLYVYRDGLLQGVAGPDHLVYEAEVTNGGVREFVYVDAHTGKIVNRISGIQTDLHRILYEESTNNLVWEEGDPFPGSLDGDQQNIVNFSGDSYYFFLNAFGWDSYDNNGAFMRSVNNDPRINCPNANWNGITTNYCSGVTADDVVAHEWGHAYTDYTSDLIYQWQSGALNESYSDIWGEVVDQLNGAGTDSPSGARTVGVCSSFTTPLVTLTVNSPASIAGDYAAAGADFGPGLDQAGLTGDVVLADDGDGTTTDACQPLVNGAAVAGNIALVDRGACAFTIKVANAQAAGATGVIVANNVIGAPFTMGGSDPTITIPSVMVSQGTGNILKGELPGVNATMRLGGATTEDSYRWLMGEDATAFGGAIRDMWAPTCRQDPGKVTDEEYHCATTDAGGVHTNSGVPNHAFALLVDGGTYNGQTITAIGLEKAAHIFWRAQETYLGRASNFVDMADSLEASCSDLVGQPLSGLGTESTPPAPFAETISAADCAEVSDAIAAVEFRVDPTDQCGFEPVLAQDAPALCADIPGTVPVSTYLDDFESGLGAWALSNEGVYSGWPGYDWALASSLPGNRSGSAAFGIDPNAGNCDQGAGDVSGVMRLESGEITVPASATIDPRLAFEHYVATEFGWDGGNLKISVNGGAYQLVPPSAFTFNAYNTTLQTAAAGNTNPLAGQAGFSGTDGGEIGGSWGQSQLDLGSLNVMPGDTVQLRYDMGIDGCTGIDGWYVDDVNVYSCELPPDCSAAYASPDGLWPPNHMFQAIEVQGVTDPLGDPLAITVTGIRQDEAVDARDSGNTSPDGRGVGTATAEVRAERVESGNGRVYYIEFMATNPRGASCTSTVEVGVPVGRNDTAVGDGPLYDSTEQP